MNSNKVPAKLGWKVAAGILVGAGLAVADYYSTRGAINSHSTTSLALLVSFLFGFFLEMGGWPASLAAWLGLPLGRLVQALLGLLSTASTGLFATLFLTLLLTVVGFGVGLFLRRLNKFSA